MIIYKVTNLINKKIYIGLTTTSLHQRKLEHERSQDDTYFHRAIKKYGKENFQWEEIDYANSLEELAEKEKYYIQFYNSLGEGGYNLTTGGEHGFSQYFTESGMRKGERNPAAKKIINLNTLEIYGCIKDAAAACGLGPDTFTLVLNGTYRDAGGYKWEVYDETKEYKPIPLTKEDIKKSNCKKKVINKTTGEIFNSISAAAEAYHCARKTIRLCCDGVKDNYNGNFWSYLLLEEK